MIVTTHQPIFLPWPGLFAKAIRADTIVFLDEVQFPLGRSWMTRNRLKGDQGELWLTVPVRKKGRGKQPISSAEICEERDWRNKHLESIRQHYADAPYLGELFPSLESIYARNHRLLVDLNMDLIRFFFDCMRITTGVALQSPLGMRRESGSSLLVSVSRAVAADSYLALPPVEKYLDAGLFRAANIGLRFARFDPPVYPQLWGDFRANLSVLDLLLNCGPAKSMEIIGKSCPIR